MEQNLVGYLLNALDPETHHQVEDYLRTNPEARTRLDLLRQCLEPLEADRDGLEPPPGLAARTLAYVTEQSPNGLPRAPLTPSARSLGSARPMWRRADVLVAASLLLLLSGLAVPSAMYLRFLHQRALCQKNLAEIYVGLHSYSERNNKKLPSVVEVADKPRNVAGMVVPLLIKCGDLPDDFQFHCPGNVGKPYPPKFDEMVNLPHEEFVRRATHLTPCYGYSLGYRNGDGNFHGPALHSELPTASLAVMADTPPLHSLTDNSPNHALKGQNVLYLDGHVKFAKDRHAGFNGDDIYLNRDKKMKAGVDWKDTVIGHSHAQP